MAENHNEVAVAFDILLEEIKNLIELLKQEGATAFREGNFESVRHLGERASQVTAFLEKVRDLQQEAWNIGVARPKGPPPAESPSTGRLPPGLRTPEGNFYVPILRVLIKMGGKGQAADILDRVGELMKPTLNEYDFETSAYGPRWRRAANWARLRMVKKGWLSSTSLRGIWEITDTGRQYLAAKARSVT